MVNFNPNISQVQPKMNFPAGRTDGNEANTSINARGFM